MKAKNNERKAYLSAITTSFLFSKSTTFLTKAGPAFFALTLSLWVCPQPNR